MMFRRSVPVAMIVAALLSGCTGSSQTYQAKPPPKVEGTAVKEGLDQNLFPMAEGNQWTYVVEETQIVRGQSQSRSSENTFKITKVEKLPDGTKATLDVTTDGTVTDRQIWVANASGIYQVSAGLPKPRVSDPMQPLVLFPATAGKTFKWVGKSQLPDGSTGTNTVDTKILGMQTADTAADSVQALVVEQTTEFGSGKTKGTQISQAFLAPGIGIARYRQEARFAVGARIVLLKLKSHSFK